MNILNLKDLFEIEYGHVFFRLDESIKDRLIKYPSILTRLENTIYFANQIYYENESQKNRAEGYLRATLCEFVSIEELSHIKIFKTKHPLIILLKLLRNINVHIDTHIIDEEPQNVIIFDKEVNTKMIYIKNLDIRQLEKTDFVKNNYKSIEDFEIVLSWFNENSLKWGIKEIILRAVYIYSEIIISEISSGK